MSPRGALWSFAVIGLLSGCTLHQQTAPQPVLASGCPPQLMGHALHVMKQVPRVRLGSDKLTTQGLLGNPLRAESFLLSDGQMVEVLSYPTPEGACPAPGQTGQLLPFVFQNNRLIGYGSQYYRDFVVPTLKTPLAMPATPPTPQQASQLETTPSAGNAYPGRMVQEDLPNQRQMVETQSYPDEEGHPLVLSPEYAIDPRYRQQPQSQIGRGQPLQ